MEFSAQQIATLLHGDVEGDENSVVTNLSKIALESKEENDIFDKKTILFLGRLCIQKAPWHLIKAFSLLIKIPPIFCNDSYSKSSAFLP